jgi:hypothetical protein
MAARKILLRTVESRTLLRFFDSVIMIMYMCTAIFITGAFAMAPAWSSASVEAVAAAGATEVNVLRSGAAAEQGIRFVCQPGQIDRIESRMDAYLDALDIGTELVVKKIDRANGTALYTLNTPSDDVDTLTLKARRAFNIRDEVVSLPIKDDTERRIQTVSRKEILLALLQHGRLTEIKSCDLETLKDHVGIRQNTVAWAENLAWRWPEGESAEWNLKYWKRGTPQPGFPLHEAINDVFINQDSYSIGCYTATKLAMIQGVLDYYHRVKQDPVRLKLVEDRLSVDHEPLVDIEPGKMWDFEVDFDQKESTRPGKLLTIRYDIAPNNFIPGDWAYFLNTDPVSYQKTGYEGSNSIYLGRNKFDDYYNDNEHSYTFRQKLDEVFQWRHGVFSRARDFARIKPLNEQDLARLAKTPEHGGLVTDLRVFPYFLGDEALPEM